MLALLQNIINSNAFSGIVGVIIGIAIGYWTQLLQSRRIEYNELADELFLYFDRNVYPSTANSLSIPDTQVKLIRRRMGKKQLRAFDAAIIAYENALKKTETSNVGHYRFTNPEEVKQTMVRLCEILHRK